MERAPHVKRTCVYILGRHSAKMTGCAGINRSREKRNMSTSKDEKKRRDISDNWESGEHMDCVKFKCCVIKSSENKTNFK